ncbi:MAG: hypothetical protein KatS3mg003_0411 [Candidatus Nitrosocaldaceae archaeon]|nr:MAG: hypothetical protein KatS3mg003_0411 [Candidatus Nitrosocaldaceae archaeon]
MYKRKNINLNNHKFEAKSIEEILVDYPALVDIKQALRYKKL